MGKLNQIIAVEKGIKSQVDAAITKTYHAVQKPDLFNGFHKRYEKNSEDGEDLPAESKRVQYGVPTALMEVELNLSQLFDVTARKDWTNCQAKADIRLGDEVLVPGVPVTFLLFLEKKLTDLRTFVSHLPVLDPAQDWDKDTNSGLYKSKETRTHRTKKVQKPIVLYPHSAEHPAQTQLITEDQLAGHWILQHHSAAIAATDKQALYARVEELLIAVKEARTEANMVEEATLPKVSEKIFSYLLPR